MIKLKTILIVSAALILTLTGTGFGQTTLRHEGDLTDLWGVAVPDGEYAFGFSLWTAEVGGEQLWEVQHQAVTVRGGRFDVELGWPAPIAFETGAMWLETVADGDLLEPRVAVSLSGTNCTVDGNLTVNGNSIIFPQETGDVLINGVNGGLGLQNRAAGSITFITDPTTTGGSVRMTITNTGEVGIGTVSPQDTLDVGGRAYIRGGDDASLLDGTGYLVLGDEDGANLVLDNNEINRRNNGETGPLFLQRTGGDVWVGFGIVHVSDARVKRDVEDLDYGLEAVLRLRPVSFSWKGSEDESRHIGLVAQEVSEVMNELVYDSGDDQGLLGVAYPNVVPVLIRAIQDQQQEIEEVRRELAELKDRLGED